MRLIIVLVFSVLSIQTSVACICTKIFMPVCADGMSYSNSCEAECAGKKSWTQGACEKNKKSHAETTVTPKKQVKPKITPTYKNKKKK